MKYISALTLLFSSPATLAVPFLVGTTATKHQKQNWTEVSGFDVDMYTTESTVIGLSSLQVNAQTEAKFFAGSNVKTEDKKEDDPFYCIGHTIPHYIQATVSGSKGQIPAGGFHVGGFTLSPEQITDMLANPKGSTSPSIYYFVPKNNNKPLNTNQIAMDEPWVDASWKKWKNNTPSTASSAKSGAIDTSKSEVDGYNYQSYGIQSFSYSANSVELDDNKVKGSFTWTINQNHTGISPFPVECNVISTNPAYLNVSYEYYPYNYQISYNSNQKKFIIEEVPFSSRSSAQTPTLKLTFTYNKPNIRDEDTVGTFTVTKTYGFWSGTKTLLDQTTHGESPQGMVSLYGYYPTYTASSFISPKYEDYDDAAWQWCPTIDLYSASVASLPKFEISYSTDNPLAE